MATKVTLRQKPISGNRQSLYLDFYPAITNPETGEPTRREFLKLFLFNEIEFKEQKYIDATGKEKIRIVPVLDRKGEPKKVKLNHFDKLHNQNTLKTAEHIRQKRQNILDKPEIYTEHESQQSKLKEWGEQNFVTYFKQLANRRKASNYDNWFSAYNYLQTFTKGNLKLPTLTKSFAMTLKNIYLLPKATKAAKQHFPKIRLFRISNKLKATMKQAYKDGFLQTDLNGKIEPIKPAKPEGTF